MKKSDSMRVLMKNLSENKTEVCQNSHKPEKKEELKDHIFKSNQIFEIIKKKILRRKD